MSDFSGKIVVVTGGAQGIGRSIAEYLLERNASVVIADCDEEAGAEILGHLNYHERLCFIPTDVRSEESVLACVKNTVKQFEPSMDWLIMPVLPGQVINRLLK